MSDERAKTLSNLTVKEVFLAIKNPTNAGTRFIKYSLIAISVGMTYFKFLRPMKKEYEFHRDEKWASELFELEMKQQKAKQEA